MYYVVPWWLHTRPDNVMHQHFLLSMTSQERMSREGKIDKESKNTCKVHNDVPSITV
jgi:hypothetical protein